MKIEIFLIFLMLESVRGNNVCKNLPSFPCTIQDNVLQCNRTTQTERHVKMKMVMRSDNLMEAISTQGTCLLRKSKRHKIRLSYECTESLVSYTNIEAAAKGCKCWCWFNGTATSWKPSEIEFEPVSAKSVILLFNNDESPYTAYYIRLMKTKFYNCCLDFDATVMSKKDVTPFRNGSKETVKVEFTNLEYGRYCIRLSPVEDLEKTWCVDKQVEMVNVTSKDSTPVLIPPRSESQDNRSKLMFALTGVVLALVFIGILLFVHFKCRRPSQLPEVPAVEVIDEEPIAIKEKRVFLVYYKDFPEFVNLVHKFANYLSKRCHCKVVYDEIDLGNFYDDPTRWVIENMRCSDKIIVINSEGAYYCQQAWLKKKSLDFIDQDAYWFANYLSILHEPTLSMNYSKVINTCFDFGENIYILQNVTPLVHYNIPRDLEMLFCNLHTLKPKIGKIYESKLEKRCDPCHTELSHGIKACKRFLTRNPGYLCQKLGVGTVESNITQALNNTENSAVAAEAKNSVGSLSEPRTEIELESSSSSSDGTYDRADSVTSEQSLIERYSSKDHLLSSKNVTCC